MQNNRWPREILIQMTLYQTETQIFAVHKFLKHFAVIDFRESLMLKDFAGIYFRESTFWGSKKEFNFAKFSSRENFCP